MVRDFWQIRRELLDRMEDVRSWNARNSNFLDMSPDSVMGRVVLLLGLDPPEEHGGEPLFVNTQVPSSYGLANRPNGRWIVRRTFDADRLRFRLAFNFEPLHDPGETNFGQIYSEFSVPVVEMLHQAMRYFPPHIVLDAMREDPEGNRPIVQQQRGQLVAFLRRRGFEVA
jgi:hypothetical protein